MSVKFWKKVITILVIITILGLAAVSVFCIEKAKISVERYNEMYEYFENATRTGEYSYKHAYKNLYVANNFEFKDRSNEKIAYLTFDDGPDISGVTTSVLNTLDAYGIKATFFVTYNDSEEAKALYKRIVDSGHTIGVHTATHMYEVMYASVENYLADFDRVEGLIREVTGVKPTIFRFPGGSINSYNQDIYEALIEEMTRRGYVYYDWNVSSGDATIGATVASITRNATAGYNQNANKKIILMHDGTGHVATAQALPAIIEGLAAQGYKFRALDNTVEPIVF